ncbi:hypothetical protein [Paenibacillus odorifer]|nr:hypothetical protein [Paenibacillus odorifer]
MFKVSIFEKICGKLAVNHYKFKKEGDMKLFLEKCKEEKDIILIHTKAA